MIFVGIDIAKDKHDCCILNSDGEVLFKPFTISNNLEGHSRHIYDLYKYELNERIIKIKNKTKPNFNIEEIAKQNTLRGLFAQEILQEKNNENYNEEIIEQALELGMEILE